jgi:hypothetical protein
VTSYVVPHGLELGGAMSDRDEGGLSSLLGKAEKWLEDQGVTKEALEKAKADHDAQEAGEAQARMAGERAGRAAGVGDSRVTLRGAVNGVVESGLAARAERQDDVLSITVEPVDPVPLAGGTFAGFTFGVPAGAGPGTHDLGATDVSSMQYELWLEEAQEGYFWAPEYGPGIVTISADGKTMDVQFVYQDPGSNRIELEGTVRLS